MVCRWLRFGDNRFGERPGAGAVLMATYRVGNGVEGNVGRETVAHIISSDTALASDVVRSGFVEPDARPGEDGTRKP